MARVVNKVREVWKKLRNVNRDVQIDSPCSGVDVGGGATDDDDDDGGDVAEEAYQVIEDPAAAAADNAVVAVSETALEVRAAVEVVVVSGDDDDPCDEDFTPSDLTEYHEMGLSATEVQILMSDVRERAEVQFPPFYDFCIVASEEDYEAADSFKRYLCATFGLRGCMLNDGFYRPGADVFSCFETMMARSTKILFYLTESFTANHFYRRLQSAAVFQSLMSHARLHREKCVPVFPQGVGRGGYVPLPLVGVAGLCPLHESAFRLCVVNSFTSQVKERRRLLNVNNSENRRQFFLQELRLTVEQHLAVKSSSRELSSVSNGQRALAASDDGGTSRSNVEGNGGGELVRTFNALPIASSDKNSLLQQVSALTELASTNVQVTDSSNVHVGPQVIVNVMVNSSSSTVAYENENQSGDDSSAESDD